MSRSFNLALLCFLAPVIAVTIFVLSNDMSRSLKMKNLATQPRWQPFGPVDTSDENEYRPYQPSDNERLMAERSSQPPADYKVVESRLHLVKKGMTKEEIEEILGVVICRSPYENYEADCKTKLSDSRYLKTYFKWNHLGEIAIHFENRSE